MPDLFEILFSGYIVVCAVSSHIIAHVINGRGGLPPYLPQIACIVMKVNPDQRIAVT